MFIYFQSLIFKYIKIIKKKVKIENCNLPMRQELNKKNKDLHKIGDFTELYRNFLCQKK